MQVTINPYHRSVVIDGVEVIQKLLPFPDEINSLASITCNYDTVTKEITEVSGIHRYVNHYIEKEYYYNNLPKFIDWFYAEKKAQADEKSIQQQEKEAVEIAIANTQKVIDKANIAIDDIQSETIKTQEIITSLQNKVTEIEQSSIEATNNAVETIKETVLEATGTLPIRLAKDFPKRSLIEHCRDIVNVKDYGAIGDGIHDDSCAFEAAIEVAIAIFAPLYIPTGLFKIDKLPSIPAIGSGRLILEEKEKTSIYHALDLLFEPDGGIVRDKETNKYKVSFEEEPKEEEPDTEGPLSPVNTQIIIDNDGEWVVPFTGYYSIMLLGGGNGGAIIQYSDTHAIVQGGKSGTVNHFYKYLTKDTSIKITIGQGGLGYNEYSESDGTSLEDTEGGITEFDIYTSDNYPHRHYHTNRIATDSFVEMTGASLGGGWYDTTTNTLLDGAYYAAGGAALCDMQNQIFQVSNGHRGAVILLYCDTSPKNSTN